MSKPYLDIVNDALRNSKYLEETNIKNNYDTRFRLFWGDLTSEVSKKDRLIKISIPTSPLNLLAVNGGLECIFYIINRFRQCFMTNSYKIDCSTTDNALLELMNDMFSLKTDGHLGDQNFSLRNFINCYRHFFRSTLIYQSITLTTR